MACTLAISKAADTPFPETSAIQTASLLSSNLVRRSNHRRPSLPAARLSARSNPAICGVSFGSRDCCISRARSKSSSWRSSWAELCFNDCSSSSFRQFEAFFCLDVEERENSVDHQEQAGKLPSSADQMGNGLRRRRRDPSDNRGNDQICHRSKKNERRQKNEPIVWKWPSRSRQVARDSWGALRYFQTKWSTEVWFLDSPAGPPPRRWHSRSPRR